jgi:hypothetical protein
MLFLQAGLVGAKGDDAAAATLLAESRAIRAEIGDRRGMIECDATLASLGVPVPT